MTSQPREITGKACPKCKATILPEAPRGFCSVCLFKTGLGELADGNDEPDVALQMPTQFGDYELQREVGRGAQGVVFRARQKSLNRTVALKIIALGHWAGAPPALTFAAPDLVIRDERGEIYSVRYDAVNAMLLNEFLKEHRKVQEQESRLAKQESIVAGQQKQIETLTAGLQKVSNRLEVAKTTLQIARSDND